MVKNINVAFENAEYDALVALKGHRSWHDFIVEELLKGVKVVKR